MLITTWIIYGYLNSVTINDVSVRHNGDYQVRVSLVDGHKPDRVSSWIITCVNYVVVSPGLHNLTVSMIDRRDEDMIETK